ncbi:MAG: TIGR02921 family PEP-CTERM protein, partial [Myxococcota bacterium]
MNPKVMTAFRWGAYLLFWGWNAWFLTWLYLGLGPLVIGQLLVAVWVGIVPVPFGLCALTLLALPAFGVALGLTPRLRGDPGRLLTVFYGVQAPLMVVVSMRLFAIQVLTPATGLALGTAIVGGIALLRLVWHGPREDRAVVQLASLVGLSGYLVAASWCAAVVALYAVAGAGNAVPNLLGDVLRFSWITPAQIAFVGFALATVTIALVFPVALVGISFRAAQLAIAAAGPRFGTRATTGIVGVTVVGLLGGFALTVRQPQQAAFDALTAATTDDARREALDRTDAIRSGLIAARLGPERLFDGDPSGAHVRQMYRPLVGEWVSEAPAAVWRGLFAPFLYRPVFEEWQWSARDGQWEDVARATEAYGAFFDVPIEVAERDRLVYAARQTWSFEDAAAGQLEAGQRKVHLASQDVRVEVHGDVAAIAIHDEYHNRTWDRQEVFLYFTVPETAAVTGLWLGPDGDRAHAFAYTVAPRGAAQEIYQSEVRVRRDPALLEQVGPRQYRLRAFPIEPRTGSVDDVWSLTSEGPPLHLFLDLVVPVTAGPDGAPVFALPTVTEVRNLFWDEDTARTLDGAPIAVDGWLPASVPAPGAAARPHEVPLGGGRAD